MPLLTSAEERRQQERKEERKQTLHNFALDMKSSFKIWIKVAGIVSALLITGYLISRFAFKWDLLYETETDYRNLFLWGFKIFAGAVVLCWGVALWLYNTKHRRKTKYKNYAESVKSKKAESNYENQGNEET